MSSTSSTIGVPIKLLNEAQGHTVTIELDNGTTFRGKLIEGIESLPYKSRGDVDADSIR